MKILVINCGSSSVKYQLFNLPAGNVLAKGLISSIGEPHAKIKNHDFALRLILERLLKGKPRLINSYREIKAVGHRVVHGASIFRQPVIIDNAVLRKIRQCCQLAPLHNPANLNGISACKKILKDTVQVAVFDTAFHQTIADYSYSYGLPFKYFQKYKIRKYGFHGTSHQYVAKMAAKELKKPLNRINLITCHLGNGCSITCVRAGKSVDTSMGFTPLEGLLMGTRCGDIDPAAALYLMEKEKISPLRMDEILNKESGLKGLSGVSNDVRLIEKAAKRGNYRARLAISVFIYRIRKYIAAYAGILGKVDAVVFTAGIGENQQGIRRRICEGLFDNLKKKPRILVVPTNEELMIAKQTYALVEKVKI